jgi:UDP:flavonoid glycosyltransferase YjiC (YdhE family)
VDQLGAGIKAEKMDAQSVLKAINEILTDSSYKQHAVSISESFRRCSGAKGAADKILQVCGNSAE